jgi:hypothetical protein
LVATVSRILSELAIRPQGQNHLQNRFKPDLYLQDKDGLREPKNPPQCLRDLLRPGQGLRLYALQTQHSLHQVQQEPEGVPHLQGKDIGLCEDLQSMINLTCHFIYLS